MRVILHADDCGLSRGISEDILLCLRRGPLASTTLMTGGDYAAEAAAALNAAPGIRVGLHLNLLEGRSTAPPASVAPLVDGRGFFRYSLGALYSDLLLLPPRRKKALLSAVRTEFSAQADCFLALRRPAGRAAAPSLCLDGHLHVHALPPLRDALRGFIREYRPAYVRLPLEPRHLPPAPPRLLLAGGLRRELLAFWSTSLRGLLDAEGVGHNRFLAGVFSGGGLTLPRLRASLEAVRRATAGDRAGICPERPKGGCGRHNPPDALTEERGGDTASATTARFNPSDAFTEEREEILEIMSHPGGLRPDESGAAVSPAFRAFYLSPARSVEKAALLSPELPVLLAETGFVPAGRAVPGVGPGTGAATDGGTEAGSAPPAGRTPASGDRA